MELYLLNFFKPFTLISESSFSCNTYQRIWIKIGRGWSGMHVHSMLRLGAEELAGKVKILKKMWG
jgi:hypothetical protein